MPSLKSADGPLPGWLTNRPIAHRGLHNAAEGVHENSLSAFRRAMDAGLPIELDVHLSADQVPVVFHDDTLERMTGDPRRVSDVTAPELERIYLAKSDECIPGLNTVLKLVGGRVPIIVELKQSPFGRDFLAQKVWDILKEYQDPYTVQSFDPAILKWFRLNAPNVIRGQLAMKSPPKRIPLYKRFLMRHMLLNNMSQPHYIGYDCDNVHTWSVKRAVKENMKLLAWTVKTEKQLGHARLHADNIIFENLPLDLVR